MAEEGHREACSYLLCPRCDGRRVQKSLLLSPVPTLWRKKGTEKLAPISCAHTVAEEGYREACSYLLCPHCGRRRAQTSFFLSPVPTLWRKKGTEKLAPISCAHAVAEGFQQKRTAPSDVDAAETVRFSWKVVGLQGQREHDVRVSR